jgi:hypothetical protein
MLAGFGGVVPQDLAVRVAHSSDVVEGGCLLVVLHLLLWS